MSEFKDWVKNVEVVTCGRGIEVRLDGSSLHDELNKYGQKARHSFVIGMGFSTKEEANNYAIAWLESQISRLRKNA